MKIPGTYDYAQLDASGEAARAVFRMEARAREPASAALFDALVRPLLDPEPRRVLEVGAGTGALARRVLGATTRTEVVATDKSRAMIDAARALAKDAPGADRARFVAWDAREEAPEAARGTYDLVLSSVMVPYLDDAETEALCRSLAARLTSGGVLAFVEQDLQTVALHHTSHAEVRGLFAQAGTNERAFFPLGLRGPLLRAGLSLLPRRSFLWTSDAYVPYLRDLVERASSDAVAAGRLPAERVASIDAELEARSHAGDFYYGLVYHLVAAQAPGDPARG